MRGSLLLGDAEEDALLAAIRLYQTALETGRPVHANSVLDIATNDHNHPVPTAATFNGILAQMGYGE